MAGTVQWIAETVLEILPISGLTLQTFLVFCVTFLLACVVFKRPRNLPPYPAGRVPLLGHLLALGRAPHLKLTAWRRQYGDVFTVRLGTEDVVVINGYTAVKDALVDRSELFASRPPVYLLEATTGFGKDIVAARWGTGFRQRKKFATTIMRKLGMKFGRGSIEEKIREEVDCLRSRLVKKGFTNIDAVDGSQKMLDLAEKKQIYRRLICDFVGPNPLDIEKDTYDAIVCCGGFAAGHLKEDCLPELIRVVKPGGYIVITFREEWLHLYEDFKDKLEPAMARLQEQGLWERVSREIFPNYYPGKDGITIVYKVL
ncbi:CYP2C8 [Branchiostoma lanceolatum]|uniref:CYP2C8 protein n=1 Tax=Branchiostoma lanceolatum TaxID=7740 RepID=A0A8K0EWF4_BRALA|nr:CYP2C8 [Branchiostoma lanceolatum]